MRKTTRYENIEVEYYDMVRKLIPEAEVFMAEENEEILGFIGFTDTYIAGIFVKETEQSKGIGTELLRTVMNLYDQLQLNVYKKNMRAVVFYQQRGFKIVNQKIDENTSEEEYTMDAEGMLHENFFLLPSGFLCIFCGL
ncbi:MAG: GNAT family N-acetyltransferase, partial [Lachnospiraceae bacterium]